MTSTHYCHLFTVLEPACNLFPTCWIVGRNNLQVHIIYRSSYFSGQLSIGHRVTLKRPVNSTHTCPVSPFLLSLWVNLFILRGSACRFIFAWIYCFSLETQLKAPSTKNLSIFALFHFIGITSWPWYSSDVVPCTAMVLTLEHDIYLFQAGN